MTAASVLAAKVVSHLDEAADVVRLAANSADEAVDVVKTARKVATKTTGEHAVVLRKNLAAEGRTVLANEDAAHILASGNPRHVEARSILDRAGIDIDDAINGGGLPSNTKVPNPLSKTTHNQTHTHKKLDQVTRELRQAELDGTVHDTLRDIEARRQSGSF